MDSTCTLSQQLVYDLGHFIGVTLEKEKLSPNAQKLRNSLQQSLQPFIVPDIEIPDEEEYEDPAPIRVCSSISDHSLSGQSDDGSKSNITLNEMKKISPKYGPLWRKEKGILREVWRKNIAGIYEQKLILFASEKDLKPSNCINIQGYVARPAPNIQKDVKKKDITFELICPGKKDYQFFARTAKDMEQWVAIICQTSIQHIDIPLPPHKISDSRLVISTDDSDMDMYDDATSAVVQVEEEEVYDDIVDSKHTEIPPAQVPPPPIISKMGHEKEENEQEELYNDVEDYEEPSPKSDAPSVMWHVEHKYNIKEHRAPPSEPHNDEEEQEEEEEIYQEIVEYQQQKLPPKSESVLKPKEVKPPSLPPRRPLPSIPKSEPSEEEEEEETYEDINNPIHSHVKQQEQNVQVPENKKNVKYEEEDFEETYDDIGSPKPNSILSVSISYKEENEEIEEIYDDVGDAEVSSHAKNQFIMDKNLNSITNLQSSHYQIGEIRNQSKTPGINDKDPVNITINVKTKETSENDQITIDSMQNPKSKEGKIPSFSQQNYLQNRSTGVKENVNNIQLSSLHNENLKKSTDMTDIKQNTNVKNISNKFNQPKNSSFLHRHSSQEEQGNVKSILQKLQFKNSGNEGKLNSTVNNPKTTDTEFPMKEKNSANFQNAFKKIEESLTSGEKPIGGHSLKPKLPINRPRSPQNQSSKFQSSESPSNTLKNGQNRPLPPKPVRSSSSVANPLNPKQNKSPVSRISTSSTEAGEKISTNLETQSSLDPSVNKSNSPSLQISVSPRQVSPMLPRNKPSISEKPEKLPNKPSMTIKVTMPIRNSTETSRFSTNSTRNKPNGLPVPIPNIPELTDMEPPKLPPRSYLKQ